MSGTPSKEIQNGDLSSTLDTSEAQYIITTRMSQWMKSVLLGEQFKIDKSTEATMGVFLDAMNLEGSYNMKPPCNDVPIVNPVDPACLKGSPWVQDSALSILVGKFTNTKAVL